MGENMFRFGQGESDEQFNARIAKNLESLEAIKRFIDGDFDDHRRFEKRIFFRDQKRGFHTDEQKIQKLKAELRSDTRELFITDAKSALNSVCRRNFNEFLDLEEAYLKREPFEFHHYLGYRLKEEERAKKGHDYKATVGYKMAAPPDAENYGDEMLLRFAMPDNLIFDKDTPEAEVQEWFDTIDEVYVEYQKTTDTGHTSETYRISKMGIQPYPIQEAITPEDLDVLTDDNARKIAEIDELKRIKFFYSMLGQMTIVPIKTTFIRIKI